MDRRDIQKLKGKPEGGVPLEERDKHLKTILKDVLIKRHENFSGSLLRTRCKDYCWAAAKTAFHKGLSFMKLATPGLHSVTASNAKSQLHLSPFLPTRDVTAVCTHLDVC